MRYQKIVTTDGVETARYDYVYSDGKLILLTYTANGVSNTARFIYDSWGEPRGFILNNTAAYIYLKNAQGDITAIVDENGEVLLTYTYTAWGKVTYSATSMESLALAATLSNVNPFTYRGYCYDYDIGMYYLQSRYYDPEICRFINADSTDYLGAFKKDTKYLKCDKDVLYETVTGYNLFSYCENDCVNDTDYDGHESKKKKPKNLEEYLVRHLNYKKRKWDGDRVSVVVTGNKITITAYFKISGDLKDKKINKKTYKKWFLTGIEKYWKGQFKVFGFDVTLKTTVGESDKKYITVKMNDELGLSNTKSANITFWRRDKNCPITLYKGDPNIKGSEKLYSSSDFQWVSAHEFGHVLGTSDVKNNTEKNTIMGAFKQKLCSTDVQRVLEAYGENCFQRWWK